MDSAGRIKELEEELARYKHLFEHQNVGSFRLDAPGLLKEMLTDE